MVRAGVAAGRRILAVALLLLVALPPLAPAEGPASGGGAARAGTAPVHLGTQPLLVNASTNGFAAATNVTLPTDPRTATGTTAGGEVPALLSDSEDSRWTTNATPGNRSVQIFSFPVAAAPNDLESLRVRWEGFGGVGGTGPVTLSAWNASSVRWEALASATFPDPSDGILVRFLEPPGFFIGGGQVHLAVDSLAGALGIAVATDRVDLAGTIVQPPATITAPVAFAGTIVLAHGGILVAAGGSLSLTNATLRMDSPRPTLLTVASGGTFRCTGSTVDDSPDDVDDAGPGDSVFAVLAQAGASIVLRGCAVRGAGSAKDPLGSTVTGLTVRTSTAILEDIDLRSAGIALTVAGAKETEVRASRVAGGGPDLAVEDSRVRLVGTAAPRAQVTGAGRVERWTMLTVAVADGAVPPKAVAGAELEVRDLAGVRYATAAFAGNDSRSAVAPNGSGIPFVIEALTATEEATGATDAPLGIRLRYRDVERTRTLATPAPAETVLLTLPYPVHQDRATPVADAGPDLATDEDVPILLSANRSTDDDPEFLLVGSFLWNWSELGTAVEAAGIGNTTVFATPGRYTVTLTVVDGAGNRAWDDVLVTVRDRTPPAIAALPDVDVVEDAAVSLAVDVVDNDPDFARTGRIVWTVGAGAAAVNDTGASVRHTFPTPGDIPVRLVATDAAGNARNASFTVRVKDLTNPVARLGGNRTVPVGARVVYNAANSTDNDPRFPASGNFTWTFAREDGTGTPTVLEGPEVEFVPKRPGAYRVTLEATDPSGLTGIGRVVLTVEPQAATDPGNTAVYAGLAIALLLLLALAAGIWATRTSKTARRIAVPKMRGADALLPEETDDAEE